MTDLLGELDDLISGDADQVSYKHELAISMFTNELSRIMSRDGITQADLARRLGVSRARVSQLLQHKSSPSLHTMVQVAHAIGCDIDLKFSPQRTDRPIGRRSISAVV